VTCLCRWRYPPCQHPGCPAGVKTGRPFVCEPSPAALTPGAGLSPALARLPLAFHHLCSRPSQMAALSCVGMGAAAGWPVLHSARRLVSLGLSSLRSKGSREPEASWASQAGGQGTSLESRLLGAPACLPARGHLHISNLQPCSQERSGSGCAVLCHPMPGAAVPLAQPSMVPLRAGRNLLLTEGLALH